MDKFIIAVITAIATTIFSYFLNNYKNNEKEEGNRDKEYLDIIIRFFEVKKVNKDFSVIEYLEGYKYKTKAIPPYVFYAIDKMHYEDNVIQKILKYDYLERIPTSSNFLFKTIKKVCILFGYFIGIITIFLLIYSVPALWVKSDISIKEGIKLFGIGFIIFLCGVITILAVAIILLKSTDNFLSSFSNYRVDVKGIKTILNKKFKKIGIKKIKIRRFKDSKQDYFILL